MPTKTRNRKSVQRAQQREADKRALLNSSELKQASEREVLQRAVTPHSMHSDVPGLQRTLGNRSVAHLIGTQTPGSSRQTSNVVQRYEPPTKVEVMQTPVQQKPYYRIREIMPDLQRVVAILSERPPRYDTAKSMVQNIYSAMDSWFGELMDSKRLMKVFGTVSGGGTQWCFDARRSIGEMYAVIHRAQYDAQIRGETTPRPTLIQQQLAVVEFAVPYFEKLENAVSYELREAETLPDVPTKFTRLPRTHAHVLAWLVKYKAEIGSAAAKFKVDRRAVAGAIAWEAIVQVKAGSFRAVGPGKAHIWEFRGTSAVDEVEEMGYLPDRDDDQQEKILKTPSGSTQYIAAIMGAFADISDGYGLNIRNDPGVLTTIYQGWSPSEWKDHMKNKKQPQGQPWPRPVVANPMGIWVDQYLPYLEEAVGFTPVEKQALGEKQYKATGEGKIAPVP